ncbi:hypothetical protein cyc_02430 [Cyclospora cayetanensis]|uniref:Methyltransferase domain-containing protein n=1 Tax=Cyclospora cayetanensis TaxID=88456 RepID=A0A1D3CYZ4_9EIME|nr:hypothetical protein cyc_02430 [Cyclospora cayetanensis]
MLRRLFPVKVLQQQRLVKHSLRHMASRAPSTVAGTQQPEPQKQQQECEVQQQEREVQQQQTLQQTLQHVVQRIVFSSAVRVRSFLSSSSSSGAVRGWCNSGIRYSPSAAARQQQLPQSVPLQQIVPRVLLLHPHYDPTSSTLELLPHTLQQQLQPQEQRQDGDRRARRQQQRLLQKQQNRRQGSASQPPSGTQPTAQTSAHTAGSLPAAGSAGAAALTDIPSPFELPFPWQLGPSERLYAYLCSVGTSPPAAAAGGLATTPTACAAMWGSLVRGQRVLDCGCYEGCGVQMLLEQLGAAAAVGVDLSGAAVAAANRRCQQQVAAGRAAVLQGDLCDSSMLPRLQQQLHHMRQHRQNAAGGAAGRASPPAVAGEPPHSAQSNQFDVAVSVEVLSTSLSRPLFFRAVSRLLRHGGPPCLRGGNAGVAVAPATWQPVAVVAASIP